MKSRTFLGSGARRRAEELLHRGHFPRLLIGLLLLELGEGRQGGVRRVRLWRRGLGVGLCLSSVTAGIRRLLLSLQPGTKDVRQSKYQ